MTDSVSSAFTDWGAFYTMTGSAAAALTGLMFVVITLITSGGRVAASSEAHAAFSTPTVLHFSTALLLAAILLAPWHAVLYAGVLVAIVGAYGLTHIANVILKARRLNSYRPDLEDWLWYTVLPIAAYGAICGGGIFLHGDPGHAMCAIAAGTLALMFIGIRNAWDVVTYIFLSREGDGATAGPIEASPPEQPPASDVSPPADAGESAPAEAAST